MNKNLEEIIEKIMNTVEIINEYGSYVDAYVKEQRGFQYGMNIFCDIATNIQKKMIFEENKELYMRILDNAIKKFTKGDILLELKEPLHNLGLDIDQYINEIKPETVKDILNEVVKNINKDDVMNIIKKYQMTGK